VQIARNASAPQYGAPQHISEIRRTDLGFIPKIKERLMRHLLKVVTGGLIALSGILASVHAVAQEKIKIGFIAPMSGPFASYGQAFHNSMLAYMDNHGDTVAGKKIEVIVRDNSSNTPDTAKRLAQELLTRDRVDFLTGFALTPDALAVAPLATQAKKPTILMLAGTAGLPAKSPYLARVSFTLTQATVPMAMWAYKNGIRKIYMAVSDYAPGHDSEEAFRKAFVAQGGQIVGNVRIPLGNTDYAAYVQRIKDSAPEAVFAFLPPGEPISLFMKSYVERGLHKTGMKVLTTMDVAEEFIAPMGDAALNIINSVSYYESLSNEENTRYINAYRKRSGKYPGAIAVGGYDGMAAIYQSARKLGGKVSDGDAVMATLKGMEINSPRGVFTIDAATRDIVQSIYIAKIEKRDGRYVPVVIDTFKNVKDSR
jgi:branched-chain amino acid transport system substrate-binding protein